MKTKIIQIALSLAALTVLIMSVPAQAHFGRRFDRFEDREAARSRCVERFNPRAVRGGYNRARERMALRGCMAKREFRRMDMRRYGHNGRW